MDELQTELRKPYLIVTGRSMNPSKIEIPGSVFSIGRGTDNDLQISDTLISRMHAEIILVAEGQYLLRDKGSKVGTIIKGERINEYLLEPGDEIILGDPSIAKLKFEYPAYVSTSSLNPIDTSRIDLRLTARQARFINLELMRQPEYITGRTLERLTSLYEITRTMLPMQSTKDLTESWLESLFRCLPVDCGAILLLNPVTQELEIVAQRNRDLTHSESIKVSRTIVAQTFQDNVAIRSTDASTDERFSAQQSVIIQRVSSVLSAPINSKKRVWGVCYLYSHMPGLFDSEDLEFVMATAQEAGLVIENIRLTEELRATQEQLVRSERLATIGKITSAISHELRNRLALLSGIEVIQKKYADDPEVSRFAEMVITGQRRALALVEEIREFARNRPVEYEKSARPIVPTLEKTVSLLRLDPIISKRQVQFTYTATPKLAFNDEKLEQVIINLIRNAAEATQENKGQIEVALTVEGNDALIAISDDGSGISPENLKHIWEPFFSTKGEEGTGLGLEICRRIIEAHGGTISCESTENVGTTFTIRLPLNLETQELAADMFDTITDAYPLKKIKTPSVTPTQLAQLPADVLNTLYQAVLEGDIEAANQVIDQILELDSYVAEVVQAMLKEYKFDELQELIEAATM